MHRYEMYSSMSFYKYIYIQVINSVIKIWNTFLSSQKVLCVLSNKSHCLQATTVLICINVD